MSSHHFVKEGQEPALFIADLVAVSHVEALLEWAPLVAALHTTVYDVILRGTKVDAVIVPTEEVDLFGQQLADQAPIDIIASGPGQELAAGLHFLVKKGQQAVNIVAGEPMEIFSLVLPFAGKLRITVVDGRQKWSLVDSRYRKWMPANQTLYIVKTDEHQHISHEGLQGRNTVFSTPAAGIATLSGDGLFWVGESL